MSGVPRLAPLALVLLASGCASSQGPELTDADLAMLDAIPCESVEEFNSVYFRSGSAELDGVIPSLDPARAADMPWRLEQNVYLLTRCPALSVRVRGYTSGEEPSLSPTPSDQQVLSAARAASVRAYYLRRGIAPHRIEAIGTGADATVPVIYDDPALEELDRARNRRVDSIPVLS